jgi:hypothetical protein
MGVMTSVGSSTSGRSSGARRVDPERDILSTNSATETVSALRGDRLPSLPLSSG